MSPKRLIVRTSPPKQRMPVDYGLFVEAFVFTNLMIQHHTSLPMPDELDEMDWFLLHSNLQPLPILRGTLKAISKLLEHYAGLPEQKALAARCQALLNLLPHLPGDHFVAGGERWIPHRAAFEVAARSPLDGDLQLAVQYQDRPQSKLLAYTGAPLRPGKDEAAQTANLFITLKWLVEADAQAVIQAGIGQCIFTHTAIQEIPSLSSQGEQP